MDVNLIKAFVARADLTGSDLVLRERLLQLDGGIASKRTELNALLSQADALQKEINVKNTELFADSQRLSELCDLVIQMHPGEEVV